MDKKSRLKEELRLTETGKYFFEMAEHLNKMVELPKHTNSLPIKADDRIKPYKKVDVIPISDGATNGDMIKAMFPNAKTWEVIRDDVHCAYIEFKDICEIKSFPLSWWNAPYKKEVEE